MLSFSLQGDRIYLSAAVSALRSLVTGETLRCVLVLILLIEIVIICFYSKFSSILELVLIQYWLQLAGTF